MTICLVTNTTTSLGCDDLILYFAVIISYLYSWHIVQCDLMFDVLNLLVDRFQSKDIQLIITALTNCGMVLRCEYNLCSNISYKSCRVLQER